MHEFHNQSLITKGSVKYELINAPWAAGCAPVCAGMSRVRASVVGVFACNLVAAGSSKAGYIRGSSGCVCQEGRIIRACLVTGHQHNHSAGRGLTNVYKAHPAPQTFRRVTTPQSQERQHLLEPSGRHLKQVSFYLLLTYKEVQIEIVGIFRLEKKTDINVCDVW